MTPRSLPAVLLALACTAAVAGCSSDSSSGSSGPFPTASSEPATSPSGSTSSSPPAAATTTATATSGAQNLVATPHVRSDLIAAAATAVGLTASDFTGLVAGETYYGYDASTSTYWAAGGLVPSSASLKAQVSVQDDGSYLVFERPASGSWSVHDVGEAGVGGTKCPIAVPATILTVWAWKAGACRPPN